MFFTPPAARQCTNQYFLLCQQPGKLRAGVFTIAIYKESYKLMLFALPVAWEGTN